MDPETNKMHIHQELHLAGQGCGNPLQEERINKSRK
jgi:hypothetical protein